MTERKSYCTEPDTLTNRDIWRGIAIVIFTYLGWKNAITFFNRRHGGIE